MKPLFKSHTFSVALLICLLCPICPICPISPLAHAGELIELNARDTLTAIELNRGDELRFTLLNGETRSLILLETKAEVLLTNLADTKVEKPEGGTIYRFTGRVVVDGQALTMERFVGSQESFYEPYVINGMRVWFDAVQDIFNLIVETHGACRPAKHARFAVQDATAPVCPQLTDWCPLKDNFLDIANCYRGEDCWMGAYFGASAHGGLDLNHPKGTPLWAPFDIDDHFLFNSVAAGQNNNRWRGWLTWPNGAHWIVQSHHMARLLVPEHQPLNAGAHYAEAAGVLVGARPHSHFVFKIARGDEAILLDPWILFWQRFENRRNEAGEPRAAMEPLGPAKVGDAVQFKSTRSRAGKGASKLDCFWTFGDGGFSAEANPAYAYLKAGIHPVTLAVDDGTTRRSTTQHLTVLGAADPRPGLALEAPDEPSFRNRPVQAMDVYGRPVRELPHTLAFVARPSRPVPQAKTVLLRNSGGGTLAKARLLPTVWGKGLNWLKVDTHDAGNQQSLAVSADAKALAAGTYTALVRVDCAGAVNSPQTFRVVLEVRDTPPQAEAVVDDRDAGFYATPWFWFGHRFAHWKEKGYRGFYLTNGGRAAAGEFARFMPDLRAGAYEVSFAPETPFKAGARFAVRVRHKRGDETIWVEPARSRTIGRFGFDEGADGFVEILAAGSRGQVLADAVKFVRVGDD